MTGCFYRGQAGLWPISSSVYRHYETERWDKAFHTCFAATVLLRNNKYINPIVKDDDNRALAIAQHYGCPTDFLDVTNDIRTAAYFATSDNEDHDKNPKGCLWVFTQEDFENMRLIMKFQPHEIYEIVSNETLDRFIANEYSLFLHFDMPELSRLNAQNGAFLWDFCGTLNRLTNDFSIGTCLVFQHNENERNSFRDEAVRLFPFPNQLETEIVRIFTEKQRVDGLPEYAGLIGFAYKEKKGEVINGIPTELIDEKYEFVSFPNPYYFEPSFGEYAWEKRHIAQKPYDVCKINCDKPMVCIIPERFNKSNIRQFVEIILDGIEKGDLFDIAVIFNTSKGVHCFEDFDFL